MEERTCSNCKFRSRKCFEDPCCECHTKSEWVSKEQKDKDERRIDNFKQFLKELAVLSDKYNVTKISACNDRVLFTSNSEIASISLLKLCGNDDEWYVGEMSVATSPIFMYFDREEKN